MSIFEPTNNTISFIRRVGIKNLLFFRFILNFISWFLFTEAVGLVRNGETQEKLPKKERKTEIQPISSQEATT